MPRATALTPLRELNSQLTRPVVDSFEDGEFRAAFMTVATRASTTTFRRTLMIASEFPLLGDVAAFLLVNQLAHVGVARPTDLADALDTGRSNISKIIKRLELADLVFRAADTADDRAVVVGLTTEGRIIAEQILASGAIMFVPRSTVWTDKDSAEFERLLIKLVRATS